MLTPLLLALLQAPAPKEPSLFDKPEFSESKFEAAVDSGAHMSAGAATRSAIPPVALLRIPAGRASSSSNAEARAAHAKAVELEAANRPVEAAASYARSVQLDPSAAHIVDAAVQLMAHGAPSRANAILTEGTRRYPANTDLRLALALSRFALADYEQARSLFAAVLPDARAAEGLLLVAEAAPNLAASAASMLDEWPLQKGIAMARIPDASARQRHEARTLLQKAAAQRENAERARFELAKLHLLDGRGAQAQRELEAVLSLNPSHEMAHFRLAQLHQKAGRTQAAELHLANYRKLHAERLAQEEAARKNRILLSESQR